MAKVPERSGRHSAARARPASPRLGRVAAAGAILLFSTALFGMKVPYTFEPGTIIRSAEVNANFGALETGKQDKLRSSSSITVDDDNDELSVAFGATLSGNSAHQPGLSVVNTASSTAGPSCDYGGSALHGKSSSAYCGGYAFAGVAGESDAPLYGVGVSGTSHSSDGGYGVMATYEGGADGAAILGYNSAGSGVVLRTYGGTIEVDSRVAPLAFVHRATAGNTSGEKTCLDSPLANGKADALVTVTHNLSASGGARLSGSPGVEFDGGLQRWCIIAEDGSALLGHAFNVMVLWQR